MKIFDKKLLFILICLFAIICIAIYFYTRNENETYISSNDLYVSSDTIPNEESFAEIVVHIDGEVTNPGIVRLPENSRISDAIEASGGHTDLADISKVNLAYLLTDGQKIHIPSIYDENVESYIESNAGNNVLVPDVSSNSNIININTATKEELDTLPGIGASTASKIIDYRNKSGKFKKIEDIMNVSGIGESKFNNIKDYICI